MKQIDFQTSGTCSRLIHIELDDDNVITACQFFGGCNGNLQGISRLIIGQKAQDVIDRVAGISCNGGPTSCPDQLSKALAEAIK
ncbi:MAG: TIGR03905 family TSCPD domain-containing protein [Bacteroidales bacterium]|nr:TIGR03905 family TSCPD domain-containing protein [Bacteroidales bacterium]